MNILNKDNASCQLLGLAYYPTPDGDNWKKNTAAAVELAGAQSSVKALIAACYGHTAMRCVGSAIGTYQRFRTDKERSHKAFTIRTLDHVVHALVLPAPGQAETYEVITSRTSATPQDGLYQVLQLYTPYPVLESWANTLFDQGLAHNLIVELDVVGTFDWAYLIHKNWDELLDQLAQEGRLPIHG